MRQENRGNKIKENEKWVKEKNASLKIIPFPKIENAYLVFSAKKNNSRSYPDELLLKTTVSFVWANEEGGCEWEPEYGPFTALIPCQESDEEALPHWLYPFYKGQGYWTQLAVDETHIKFYLKNGDYAEVFNILKEYSPQNFDK